MFCLYNMSLCVAPLWHSISVEVMNYVSLREPDVVFEEATAVGWAAHVQLGIHLEVPSSTISQDCPGPELATIVVGQ